MTRTGRRLANTPFRANSKRLAPGRAHWDRPLGPPGTEQYRIAFGQLASYPPAADDCSVDRSAADQLSGKQMVSERPATAAKRLSGLGDQADTVTRQYGNHTTTLLSNRIMSPR
jgi:hypothetical protein